MKASIAFGVEFYRHFTTERIGEFLVGALGIPLMGHAWLWIACAQILSFFNLVIHLFRRGKKSEATKDGSKETEAVE